MRSWIARTWNAWRFRLWRRWNPLYTVERDVDQDIDVSRCAHTDLRVADARLTQEGGMGIYLSMLLECHECRDMWRVQRLFGEVTQITGGHERFLSTRELGLEVSGEGGLVKTDRAEETLRILREQRMPGARVPYDPYQVPKKKRKPRKHK